MAYDKTLASRIRKSLKGKRFLTEKEMFGGVGFLIRGNVACGVIGSDMIVRVGPEAHAAALKEPHVRPFDFSGRPMKGWVFVGSAAVQREAGLKRWVERGLAFAAGLPPK
jgi:hypothetical protein